MHSKETLFATLVVLTTSIPLSAHANDSDKVTPDTEKIGVSSCFGGQNLFGCSVRADNDPKKRKLATRQVLHIL